MQSMTLLITRLRFHNGELFVHGLIHVSDAHIAELASSKGGDARGG